MQILVSFLACSRSPKIRQKLIMDVEDATNI